VANAEINRIRDGRHPDIHPTAEFAIHSVLNREYLIPKKPRNLYFGAKW
jgi:hypothetical protein